MKARYIAIVLAVAYAFILSVLLRVEVHRAVGSARDMWVLLAYLALVLATVGSLRLLLGGSRYGLSALLFTAAFCSYFLAWYAAPAQVYQRAKDRFADVDRAAEFIDQSVSPERKALNEDRVERERAARELELEAAQIRWEGDAAFFRSRFWTFHLLFIASILAAVGLWRMPRRAKSGA